MAWLFSCIRPRVREESSQGRYCGSQQDILWSHSNNADNRVVNYIELLRHLDEPLGLEVRGGSDQEAPVYIEALRPGGVAQKSDALQVGDYIQAINGIATDRLTQREVVSLLRNAGTVINLEVSYEIAEDEKSREDVQFLTMVVQLFCEGSSFGFTIRGGREENRPITIAHIVQHSLVYRAGIVKVGDRVLQINGCSVENASQLDALTILRGASDMVTMVIEYEVEIQEEKLRNATNPLLVKALKPPLSTFGITLSGTSSPGDPIWITEVKQGSIADRCGAIHVGDQLLSVNNYVLDICSVQEAAQLVISSDIHIELQIMPAHNFTVRPGFGSCLATDSVIFCDVTNRVMPPSRHPSSVSLVTSGCHPLTSHPESVTVTVTSDDVGFGITLRGGATDHRNRPVKIAEVVPDGPAIRLGQLKSGDRVLAINGISLEGVTLHTALKLANENKESVTMEIEFDVEEPVVPNVGSFDVKLIKIGMSLGITIDGAQSPGAPVWIAGVKKGGAAYRTSLVKAGDIISAINGQSCNHVTFTDAVTMLRRTSEVVQLRITKEGSNSTDKRTSKWLADSADTITYSVQLNRDDQQLGIVLGMTQLGEPVIKALIDGVARRTGTVRTGDHILAIDGDSLAGKTLLQVEEMLEQSGNTVTLKIKKNVKHSKLRSKQPSPIGKEARKDSLKLKMSSTIPLQYGACGMPTLESASQGYSFLDSINDSDNGSTEQPANQLIQSTQPNTARNNDTSVSPHADTDVNRGSYTEDEMSSLDEEQSSRMGRPLSRDDNKLYHTTPHRTSRVSQIPAARAAMKRDYSLSFSKRKQLEDLENSNFSEETIQQIRSTLIESGKYINRFSKIAEQHSSSDPDSDYEPTYKGRHRLPPKYASNKFTNYIQHKVRLVKGDHSSDFGFSVSDSAFEPGIYIHKLKPGGPADVNGLKSYDRILKINQYPVRDLNCSRALPLLAKCGNEVSLVVSRNIQASNRYSLLQQTEEI